MKKLMIVILLCELIMTSLPVQSVKAISNPGLKEKKMILRVGEKKQACLSAALKKRVKKIIRWKSSRKKVATVTRQGVVRAVSAGTSVVTVLIKPKNKQGIKKLAYRVTVVQDSGMASSEPAPTQTGAPQSAGTPGIVSTVMPLSTEAPGKLSTLVPEAAVDSGVAAVPVVTLKPLQLVTFSPVEAVPLVSPGVLDPIQGGVSVPTPAALALPAYDIQVPVQGEDYFNGRYELKGIGKEGISGDDSFLNMAEGTVIASVDELSVFLERVKNETAGLFSDKEQGKKYSESFLQQFQNYDAGFFERKSLLISGGFLFGRGYEQSVLQLTRSDTVLACEIGMRYAVPDDQAVTDDAVSYVAMIAVNKEDIQGITTFKVFLV